MNSSLEKRCFGQEPEFTGTLFVRKIDKKSKNKDIAVIFGMLGSEILDSLTNEKQYIISGYKDSDGSIDLKIHNEPKEVQSQNKSISALLSSQIWQV